MNDEIRFFEQLTWGVGSSVKPESVDILTEQVEMYPALNPAKCKVIASIFRAYPEVNIQQLQEIARILEP